MKRGSNILTYFSSESSKRVKSTGSVAAVTKTTEINAAVNNKSESISTVEISTSTEVTHEWPPLQHLNADWFQRLQKEFSKPYFSSLMNFLNTEFQSKEIYPPQNEIFNAFNACSFESIKVVILGQDPYHGPNQAHGLSFSVLCPALPPSLKNIFKELHNDLKVPVSTSGNLLKWAEQGVFLLNTCLSVRKGEANSHNQRGWEQFTTEVINQINKRSDGVVFLLWGKPAQTKGAYIDRSKHTVITSSHPSPLGAHKTNEPFMGSKCFSRCNEALVRMGKEPVDWKL